MLQLTGGMLQQPTLQLTGGMLQQPMLQLTGGMLQLPMLQLTGGMHQQGPATQQRVGGSTQPAGHATLFRGLQL